nr:hypothetical protein [Actinomycetales bacterium]
MRYLPEKSLRAALAGVEAAVLTWLTTALLAMVAYAATAGAPGMADATWSTAVGAGTRLWALGFGGTMLLDEAVLTLIPLGITLMAVLLLRGSMRRASLGTLGQVGVAGGAFVVAVAALGLAGGVEAGRHLLGAVGIAVVAGIAALWGSSAGLPAPLARWLRQLPAEVGEGARSGMRLLRWLGLLGVALVAAALFVSWDLVSEISGSLEAGAVSGIAFGLVQAAFLPNLSAWALSWVAGPGFTVGTGTSFAPTEVLTEPLPAIPVFGALPAPGSEPGLLVVLVPVIFGAAWALWRSRRAADPAGWAELGIRVGTAFAVVFLGFLAWFLLAGGALGPGRMAEVGITSPLLAALVLAAEAVAGYALALVTFRLVGQFGSGRAPRVVEAVADADDPAEGEFEDQLGFDVENAPGREEATSPDTEDADDLPAFGTGATPVPAVPAAAPTAATAPLALTAPTAFTAEVPEDWYAHEGDGKSASLPLEQADPEERKV